MRYIIRNFSSRRLRAFSLPELLVLLFIIGILVLIVLPNLMPLISRAKASEAQEQLTFLHTLQKSNFYTYSKYSESLEELGFELQPVVSDGGSANYRIEIVEASEYGFRPRSQRSWTSTETTSTMSGRSTRTRIWERLSKTDSDECRVALPVSVAACSACSDRRGQLLSSADARKGNHLPAIPTLLRGHLSETRIRETLLGNSKALPLTLFRVTSSSKINTCIW